MTTNIDDTNVGLTVGDVLRTRLYYSWAGQTVGDVASNFVRRDIEDLVIIMPDGSVRLLSQRALTQAPLPSSQELFETSRSPSEVDLEDIAVENAARPVTSAQLATPEVGRSSEPAMKALATMLASNKRRLLVEDSHGHLAGIAAQRDLTRTVLLQMHTARRSTNSRSSSPD
ncbi:MAG: CBS domain-containing protein [Ilumatobacter sp.]